MISTRPGRSFEDVQANCGFELHRADDLDETKPPTGEELQVLRTQVDPYRYVIGRG